MTCVSYSSYSNNRKSSLSGGNYDAKSYFPNQKFGRSCLSRVVVIDRVKSGDRDDYQFARQRRQRTGCKTVTASVGSEGFLPRRKRRKSSDLSRRQAGCLRSLIHRRV